ncbi:FMN-binding negative transcriptional regulator [Deinococcus detaillensis]|uniref:FMN-binding negative transcriptional regulator n=1 Tax=Deinococcus detaillensis TaxID=2592048 RepID=A0A553ULJ2_9DEIO|nr:FMN-binding negative transcriptional regulator [Deinococcus detaillensis]TSA81073.1 FMN-binding negative transcriptional regulator [Deinococcus detaillensis]
MYSPAHFRLTDQAELLRFMRAHSFATLITAPGGVPFASHIPLLIESEQSADGSEALYLRSHLARANPQWQHFGEADSLVIFQGPHALIDPAWYESRPNVPTWNYAAVHAYGQAQVVAGEATRRIAYGLVEQHTPGMAPIPADLERRMLAGVVTFELRVGKLEGKYKLSQNKTAADRANVQRELALSGSEHERTTAELMKVHSAD